MNPAQLKGRDFLRVNDWSSDELLTVLELADWLKAQQRRRAAHRQLEGRAVGLIFQKPSTRTRVSFEVGIAQLGATPVVLGTHDLQLGRGETVEDTALVLSRYLNAIVIRTYAQADVDELAHYASIPIVNGLTNEFHPCQALADILTMRERFGRLEGLRVAYLGDGNNVCHSLMVACAKLGISVIVATPERYQPDGLVVGWAREAAALSGGSVELVSDPAAAVAQADVLYTDTWTSMGWEQEREERNAAFQPYQLNAELLASAPTGALVLHDLPATYGLEVTHDVLHGQQSGAWDQAENRLHTQKALLTLVVP